MVMIVILALGHLLEPLQKVRKGIMQSVKWDWCRLTQLIQLCIGPTVSAGSHCHRQPEGNVHAGDRGAHTVETEQRRLCE